MDTERRLQARWVLCITRTEGKLRREKEEASHAITRLVHDLQNRLR